MPEYGTALPHRVWARKRFHADQAKFFLSVLIVLSLRELNAGMTSSQPLELFEHHRLGRPDGLLRLMYGFLVRRHRTAGDRSRLRGALPGIAHQSQQPIGTPEAVMLEQFQWLAEEVMPAFKLPQR